MSSLDKTLPFLIDYLPDVYRKIAKEELNENVDQIPYFLEDLRKMTKGDFILKEIDFHPDLLVQFLRVSKYNSAVAFKRLHKYIHLRRKIFSYFVGLGDKISLSPAYSWASPLPWRSPEGCAVVVIKFAMWDNVVSWEDLSRLLLSIFHQSLRSPLTQIAGLILILDYQDTGMRHLKHVTPSNMYQIVQMYMECNAARLKRFHCVNCSLHMRIAWQCLKPFMPEKLRKRVIFHKHTKELQEYMPKHTLPVEYGGEIKNFYMHSWMQEASEQMALSTLAGQQNTF